MESAYTRSTALLLILAVLVVLPTTAAAGSAVPGGAMYIKGGSVQVQDTTQVFSNSAKSLIDVGLNAMSSRTLNVGWELRLRQGWAVGTEYLAYDNRFTPQGSTIPGTAETRALMVTGKKYFLADGHFHPYVGGGIGTGATDVSNSRAGGIVDDYNIHILLHALLGVELRIDDLSILLEARTLQYVVAHDKIDYNPSGTSVLLGVGFNW